MELTSVKKHFNKDGNKINDLSALPFLPVATEIVVDSPWDKEQCCDARILAKVRTKQDS